MIELKRTSARTRAQLGYKEVRCTRASTELESHGQQQQARRAAEQPKADVRMNDKSESLSKRQQKSAARLQVFNMEMEAILRLKIRAFMLRALKRARHDRVWRVAGPHLAARGASPATPMLISSAEKAAVETVSGDRSSGTKRADRSSPSKVGSPSSPTLPSKSRQRNGTTPSITAGNGPGSYSNALRS